MAATETSVNGVVEKPKHSSDIRIGLGELTQHNIKQLRIINRTVFPVVYTDKFYIELLKNPQFCRLAYFNDIVVGAVCYRLENIAGCDNAKNCYIMTLGCLAPYRRYGIGAMLLQHVLKRCMKNKQIRTIFLHVHVENEEAVAFYKKFGFDITGKVENYYKRLSPQDAYIVEKQLDHSGAGDDSDSD